MQASSRLIFEMVIAKMGGVTEALWYGRGPRNRK
jgi:hypothetical protein